VKLVPYLILLTVCALLIVVGMVIAGADRYIPPPADRLTVAIHHLVDGRIIT